MSKIWQYTINIFLKNMFYVCTLMYKWYLSLFLKCFLWILHDANFFLYIGNASTEKNGVSFSVQNGDVCLHDFTGKQHMFHEKEDSCNGKSRIALRRTSKRGSLHFIEQMWFLFLKSKHDAWQCEKCPISPFPQCEMYENQLILYSATSGGA